MTKKTIVMGAAAALTTAVAAFAHGGATGIVKERMDGMSAMSKVVKTLAPMMRGDIQFDAELVKQGAVEIRAHAGETMTKLFPEGSGGKPSEAKETVWENWEEFSALSERLDFYAEGLELAAENGLMAGDSSGMSSDSMMGADTLMGEGTMMAGVSMMDGTMGLEEFSDMPTDAIFNMVSQTCSACHTKFRTESK